ncbi:uncharacterized protein LOC112269314 isoform X2 [Brachypodium distachyon]|nr:uncharacterized protein LOC112269314 isoform X2 [Brachypodium distachyon]XP_024311566.1 uncharacterized protein LOC112269314 isoform X2 [Brachypodium distachyon]PNT61616.1 hypothetical protein BRADI_5g17755v3 [Brachypodium distachyon]|eukprot:XP_024311565.1 uncharacterized protein LOC112269314 isoform X2 [Brachypodium distachyon]
MSKEQMFRELRLRGLHPAVVFAVYKELRDQNNGFFREHYVKMDLRKQAERLKRLLHHYRTVRDAGAAGATTALGTAAHAMSIPDGVGGLTEAPEHRTVPIGLNGGACLVSSSIGDDSRFAAYAQTTRTPALNEQMLLQREQPVIPNGGVHGTVPSSAACATSNRAMAVSYPRPPGNREQAELLRQRWAAGASVVWTRDSYWQRPSVPPSSVETPPENSDNQGQAAPRHGRQADEPMLEWKPSRQPNIPIECLPEYRNHPVNLASRLGEQTVSLHQRRSDDTN